MRTPLTLSAVKLKYRAQIKAIKVHFHSFITPITICNLQVTTFSRLLSPDEKENLHLNGIAVELMSLMQFQTEQTFRDALK